RVVRTSQDVPEAVIVDPRPVAVHPDVRPARPVGAEVTRVVAPEAARHADPGSANHQFADLAAHRLTGRIDHIGGHPRHRAGKGARLLRLDRDAADDAATDLGSTGVVDNRAATVTWNLEEPAPRTRIPWLAGRAERTQATAIVALNPIV